jgi:hypothetical protein
MLLHELASASKIDGSQDHGYGVGRTLARSDGDAPHAHGSSDAKDQGQSQSD